MRLNKTLLAVLLVVLIGRINAQDIGGHPNGIKWRCISTDTLRLIYPAEMESQAIKLSDLIHYESNRNSKTIGGKVPKLSLVFQNQTVEPNGFVGLAPFRSEFYTTPPQDLQLLGSMNWLTSLGIHEYRHSLQYYNQRRGLVRLLYWLNGENGWSMGANFLFPPWYYEGDAVYTETKLSNAGRGRMPSFFAPLWSMANEGKQYSYKKLRNGSFKDQLPDHYAYGYLMCSYINDRNGEVSFVDITKHTARLRGIFFPFSSSLKKVVGARPSAIYEQAFSAMASDWKSQKAQQPTVEGVAFTSKSPNRYRSYKSPAFIDSNRVVAILSRLNEIKTVVEVNTRTGVEKELCKQGTTYADKLHAAAGKVVWSEVEPDIRWQNRSYSVIKLYQLSDGKIRKFGNRSKLFSPSLSPDGSKIAAVRISTDQQHEVVILSAADGKELATLPNSENLGISTPAWSAGGDRIIFVGKMGSKLALFDQSVDGSQRRMLIPYTSNVITNPTCGNGKIYFEGSFDGQDNIYAVDSNGGVPEKLTQATIGGYQPSMFGGKLVYSNYSISGSRLCLIDNPKPLAILDKYNEPRASYLPGAGRSANASPFALIDSVPSRSWKSVDYNPTAHLINIHSWGVSAAGKNIEARVASQDVLSKLSVEASWKYSDKDRSNYFTGSLLWGGWYPYVGASFTKIMDRNPFGSTFNSFKYDEQQVGAFLMLPFNLSRGFFSTNLVLMGGYDYHNIRWTKPYTETRYLHVYTVGGQFSNIRHKALQQVNPRFGQVLTAVYKNAFAGSFRKESFSGGAKLFLPGMAKTHSLEVNGDIGWETNTAAYYFYDSTYLSRGYTLFPVSKFRKASLNYSLPICYPDWGVNGIFFLKRIRLNGFYDYARAKNDFGAKRWSDYASYGVEAIFDVKVFNLMEIPFGIRQSFLLNTDPSNAKRTESAEIFVKIGLF